MTIVISKKIVGYNHVLIRVSLNTFRPPVHFPIFPEGGLGLQGFRREAPQNGAEGAVLEHFSDFSKIVT